MIDELKNILRSMDIASNVDDLQADDDLYANGVVDSLTIIQFVMNIEDHFIIRFETEDINFENLKTLKSIESYIESRKALR